MSSLESVSGALMKPQSKNENDRTRLGSEDKSTPRYATSSTSVTRTSPLSLLTPTLTEATLKKGCVGKKRRPFFGKRQLTEEDRSVL